MHCITFFFSGTCVAVLRVTINNTQSDDSFLVSRYEFWVVPKKTGIPDHWTMTSMKERRVCKWSCSFDVEYDSKNTLTVPKYCGKRCLDNLSVIFRLRKSRVCVGRLNWNSGIWQAHRRDEN
jgi:hypothetical protein